MGGCNCRLKTAAGCNRQLKEAAKQESKLEELVTLCNSRDARETTIREMKSRMVEKDACPCPAESHSD